MHTRVNDQIRLSPICASDKAACVQHLAAKEIYDGTLRIPYPYTDADFDTWLAIVERTTQEQRQPLHWAIRNADDLLIGGCGFDDLVIGQSHRAEIGYWLAKPYWGRGIATAVVGKLCEVSFNEFGLAKLTAYVFAFNTASARVLEKCGFQQEGLLHSHHKKDGRLIDSRVFGRLK